jgi:hypothetical protein
LNENQQKINSYAHSIQALQLYSPFERVSL